MSASVSGTNSALTFNVTGIGGFEFDEDGTIIGEDESDEGGEQAHEQEVFGALGILGNPLPPDDDLFAESLAKRTDDGLVTYAVRDLRLNRAVNASGGNAPRPGQIMFVGYGGGFVSHAMTTGNTGSKRGTITTIYVPYDFDSEGVAQKAHAINIDPTPGNSSISIVHGDGVFWSLTEDAGAGPGISWAINGATFGRMTAGEFVVNAAKITLRGNVYAGADTTTALPVTGAPISPSVYLSTS